jgi:hypothetical protein
MNAAIQLYRKLILRNRPQFTYHFSPENKQLLQRIQWRIVNHTFKLEVICKRIYSNAPDFCLQNEVLSECLRLGHTETAALFID